MSSNLSKQKVAIVHDWLVGGGAELVVQELHTMFPNAPIYTSYATNEWRKKLDGKVITGWLQYFGKLRKFLPVLRIWWFSRLDLSAYDLVISSSGAEAKGIKVKPGTVHVNYCHAPTHYYWSRYDEYLKSPGFGFFDPLARLGLKILVGPLRKWDYKAAQRPDYIIANSSHIKKQIKKYYGRDSEVIFPPVDTHQFSTDIHQKRSGFIVTGRQTPYKRIDLAVRACSKLGLPLTVVGDGPDHAKLQKLAGPSVKFTGHVAFSELIKHVQRAEAFIFGGLDDFGISAVEALAAGTPVIAYRGGGALDYIHKDTGLFFEQQTSESLEKALGKFKSSDFDAARVSKSAEQFSKDHFRSKFSAFFRSIGTKS